MTVSLPAGTEARPSLRLPVLAWPYLAAVLLIVGGGLVSPGFSQPGHIVLVLSLASFVGLVGAGQTLVILSGGIDLSVSSVATLAGVLSATVMAGSDAPFWPAVGVSLGAGLLFGVANGLGVAYLEIPPLVMTLGMTSLVQGLALLYTNGAPKGYAAPLLASISSGAWHGLPYLLLVWVVVATVMLLLLHRSVVGRWLYALGHAPRAAYASGVNVGLVLVAVYAISGVTAALAGILLTGYTKTSYLNIGDPYQTASIAAVVIGGTSILGGYGSYLGTIAGAIIMTTIQSLLPVLRIPEAGRQIVSGVIILLLLLLYGRGREGRD